MPPRMLKKKIAPDQLVIQAEASRSRPEKKQKSDTQAAPNTDSAYAGVKGRKKGKLDSMTEMPMDILFEIFSQLEPVDLLHLSRASKDLRSILIASNANILWKLAYQNLSSPPPICPGVNLRHYTNFIYGRHCHFCASRSGSKVGFYWPARVRLCQECIPKQTIEALISYQTPLDQEALSLCNMSSCLDRAYRPRFLKIEYDRVCQDLQVAKSNIALDNFRLEADRVRADRLKIGNSIYSWWTQQRAEHTKNLMRRRDDICIRVIAEGLGTGLEHHQISGLKLLDAKITRNAAEQLSNNEWERIKPRIILLLEYEKKKLKKEMIKRFKLRMENLSQLVNSEFNLKMVKPVIPPIVHFARKSPYAELIVKYPYRPITDWARELPGLAPRIFEITSFWRASADDCLLQLIPKSTGSAKGQKTKTNRLELATSFFQCHWCQETIWYPRILMHECLRTHQVPKEETHKVLREDTPEVYADVRANTVWNQMSLWCAGTEWNEGNKVSFDTAASGFARVIVKACGKDPSKVTFDEMNDVDARVECLTCSGKGRGNSKRLVMNWTTAILHDIDKHFEEPPNTRRWSLIDEEDTVKAKELESKLSKQWRRETSNACAFTRAPLPLDTGIRRPPYPVKI